MRKHKNQTQTDTDVADVLLPDLTPGAVYRRILRERLPDVVEYYEIVSIGPQSVTVEEVKLSGKRRTFYVQVPGTWCGLSQADAEETERNRPFYSTEGFLTLLHESERERFLTAICTMSPARATLGYRAAAYERAKCWCEPAPDSFARIVAAARYIVSMPDSAWSAVPGAAFVMAPFSLEAIARVLGWQETE